MTFRFSSLAIPTLLFLSAGVVATMSVAFTGDLVLQIAVNGNSPIAFVRRVSEGPYGGHAFDSGVIVYLNSIAMRVYPLLYQHFGISPLSVLPIHVAAEIIILFAAGVVAMRTLRPEAGWMVAIIAGIFFTAGDMMMPDFADTGARPLVFGLFYHLSLGAATFGICAFLTGRPLSAAVLLGFALANHAVLGLAATIFVVAVQLASRSRAIDRRTVLAAIVLAIFAGAWLIQIALPATGQIPDALFLELARMMSSHWFPIDRGFLWKNHTVHFVPMLAFIGLLVYYMRNDGRDLPERDRQMAFGFVAMAALTVFGLIASEYISSPILVRASLHRADIFILFLGMPYVISGLWKDATGDRLFLALLAAALLATAFVPSSSVPLLPAVLIVLLGISSGRPQRIDAGLYILGALLLLLGFLFACYAALGVMEDWTHSAYTTFEAVAIADPERKTLLAIILFVAALPRLFNVIVWPVRGTEFARRLRSSIDTAIMRKELLFLCYAGLAMMWAWDQRPLADRDRHAWATDYLAVQMWARDHTPPNALFMPDPTHYYGWEDLSQRPSFGNLRAWLYAAWVYGGTIDHMQQGLRHFSEFGLDYRCYLGKRPALDNGFGKLDRDLRKRYYSLGTDWFNRMASKYGIAYFIFDRTVKNAPPPIPVVFENRHFYVATVGPPQ